jgi:hypothetical protein
LFGGFDQRRRLRSSWTSSISMIRHM